MSVLIKDMDMPRGCAACPLWARCYEVFAAQERFIDERPEWCPLVEVPTPHGRLIDADYLLAMVEEYIEEYDATDSYGLHTDKWCGWKEAEDVIRTAKTVIEAEE